MPHYSIKDMFVSTGLIASGIMGLVAVHQWLRVSNVESLLVLLLIALYYASFILNGTGIMLQFKKLSAGISVGIVLAILSMPFCG
jgi:hypothetical protein